LQPRPGQTYHINVTVSEGAMDWTKPSFEEINLNCEISSYANAEL